MKYKREDVVMVKTLFGIKRRIINAVTENGLYLVDDFLWQNKELIIKYCSLIKESKIVDKVIV
jgi:hypothetical protein